MTNIIEVAYSIIYSHDEGICLGLEAGQKGYKNYIELDNVLGNLLIIIWTKSTEKILNEDLFFGNPEDEKFNELQELFLLCMEKGGVFKTHSGLELNLYEKIINNYNNK